MSSLSTRSQGEPSALLSGQQSGTHATVKVWMLGDSNPTGISEGGPSFQLRRPREAHRWTFYFDVSHTHAQSLCAGREARLSAHHFLVSGDFIAAAAAARDCESSPPHSEVRRALSRARRLPLLGEREVLSRLLPLLLLFVFSMSYSSLSSKNCCSSSSLPLGCPESASLSSFASLRDPPAYHTVAEHAALIGLGCHSALPPGGARVSGRTSALLGCRA